MHKDISLVWLDLEMTGLDADHDVILEIAVIVTNIDLTTIVEGPDLVIHQPQDKLQKMENIVREMHTKSGLLERVAASKISVAAAEKEVMDFIKKNCAQEIHFAGNTIYQDRTFLKRYMPKLNERGHYRMVDVSTLKILIQSWYPNSTENRFKKSKAHRALEDVRESIAELRHYRKYFFK